MNAVTLSSSTFGRGTDFQCMDDTVQQAGGIHIVQTHVASTLSEEIQMKGRTARQGEKGSWSMVLRKDPLLETYKIDDAALKQLQSGGRSAETKKALWDMINRNRMQLNMAQLEELIKFVDSNQNTHKQAVDFTDALLNSKIDAVRSYLQRRNNPKAGGMEGKARILVLLDATGSMSEMLTAAKDAVGVMFTRAGWEHAKFVPVNSSISRPRTHTHHHHKQTHTHTHTPPHTQAKSLKSTWAKGLTNSKCSLPCTATTAAALQSCSRALRGRATQKTSENSSRLPLPAAGRATKPLKSDFGMRTSRRM